MLQVTSKCGHGKVQISESLKQSHHSLCIQIAWNHFLILSTFLPRVYILDLFFHCSGLFQSLCCVLQYFPPLYWYPFFLSPRSHHSQAHSNPILIVFLYYWALYLPYSVVLGSYFFTISDFQRFHTLSFFLIKMNKCSLKSSWMTIAFRDDVCIPKLCSILHLIPKRCLIFSQNHVAAIFHTIPHSPKCGYF